MEEFRFRQIVINAVKESVQSPPRGEVADNFILLKFNLYRYIAYRPSPRPGCPIRWDSRTHLGGRDFWVDLVGIQKIPSEYRRRCRRLFQEHLATTDVPKEKHALAICQLFELVDAAVDTDLPINLEIFDVTWHNKMMVPATREFIEGLERVSLDPRLGSEEERPCAICCREDYDQQERVTLPCSHYFHRDCIVQWLQINHVCPMCRFAVPPSI